MPVYLVLVVAVAIAVARGQARIREVEALEGLRTVPRKERWASANGFERVAFVVMGLSAIVWLLLILPVGFAAAAVALGAAVWKRPYLEPVLAPVAFVGGTAIALYDLVLALVRDETDWGALMANITLFGAIWMVIGALLWASGRSRRSGEPVRRSGKV